MAKQCADSGNTPQLMDNLERMEAYTGRIERYVETMSKVQRLEQVQPEKVTFDTAALSADLEKHLAFPQPIMESSFTFTVYPQAALSHWIKGCCFKLLRTLQQMLSDLQKRMFR